MKNDFVEISADAQTRIALNESKRIINTTNAWPVGLWLGGTVADRVWTFTNYFMQMPTVA